MTARPTKTSNRSNSGPRKILVVDLGFLGDTIHLIPALWELRRHHPTAELHVVTAPVGAEVLRLAPCVDRVWMYPLADPSPPWWRHLDLQWRLVRERFDLSVNFSGADRTLFVAGFALVPYRITHESPRPARWKRWLSGRVIPAVPRSLPVFEQRRRVLATAGYELEAPRFDLQVPEADAAWAAQRVPTGTVHLSVNASSPFKEWPISRWAELTRLLLLRDGTTVLATGSAKPREQQRLAALVAAVTDPRLQVFNECPTIPRLAALLARCEAHVGTDSGVTHLAMALGVPTVSVFREYAGLEEWRPRGPQHVAVTARCRCVDQPHRQPECETAGIALCLAGITAADVARLVLPARSVPGARPRDP